jgi:hypothetical protein
VYVIIQINKKMPLQKPDDIVQGTITYDGLIAQNVNANKSVLFSHSDKVFDDLFGDETTVRPHYNDLRQIDGLVCPVDGLYEANFNISNLINPLTPINSTWSVDLTLNEPNECGFFSKNLLTASPVSNKIQFHAKEKSYIQLNNTTTPFTIYPLITPNITSNGVFTNTLLSFTTIGDSVASAYNNYISIISLQVANPSDQYNIQLVDNFSNKYKLANSLISQNGSVTMYNSIWYYVYPTGYPVGIVNITITNNVSSMSAFLGNIYFYGISTTAKVNPKPVSEDSGTTTNTLKTCEKSNLNVIATGAIGNGLDLTTITTSNTNGTITVGGLDIFSYYDGTNSLYGGIEFATINDDKKDTTITIGSGSNPTPLLMSSVMASFNIVSDTPESNDGFLQVTLIEGDRKFL